MPWNTCRKFLLFGAPLLLLLGGIILYTKRPTQTDAAPSQTGFEEQTVFSGLNNPTAIRFAKDGRVFVAEKRGVIKVFDNLTDTTPTTFADLRTNVYNFWDRGLLGLELDPDFPNKPYVYVLYTYDGVIGGVAPKWGTANTDSDPCPSPPGATTDGCVASGRLSRLQANGNVMTGSEQVLINDWCQQFPSHSIGSLAFGPDGSLYASGGDGANFGFADYGQAGGTSGGLTPKNPCGDPPTGVGGTQTAPTAEGGALRAQDLETLGDPTGLNGSIIRVNPDTGLAMPDNPLINNSNANAKRIIAYGLRNPFRFTMRPGTNEVWIGDVGWNDWEELNVVANPTDSVVENFGWPCYEGKNKQAAYDGANLNICENLYNKANAVTDPYYTYYHNDKVVPGENCPTGSSSITGVSYQFYQGGAYPAAYNGALFFGDYSRGCIWVMFNGGNGKPNPSNIKTFVAGASGPVDLEVSPDGELYYVDLDGGTIRKIRYTGAGVIPSPWTDGDVGAVAQGGSATYNNGIYSVNGSGSDIWGTEDAFNYVYQPLSGDGSIVAHITSVQNTDGWAKAGVMIRETLNDNSTHALMALTAQNGIAFQRRVTTGADSQNTSGAQVAAPYWVKLVRTGNIFTGYQSSDNSTWQQVGTVNITMAAGVYIGLAVTAHNGSLNTSTFDSVNVTASSSNKPPVPVISAPGSTVTWKVGDTINFSGSATDPEDGSVPTAKLTWKLIMHHCPSNCHTHDIQSWSGILSGSFTAPDHDYPSYLELQLTATDSKGVTGVASVTLQPKTVDLTFNSNPTGLSLTVGSTASTTSFTRTVIINSNNSMSATTPQTLNNVSYDFSSWSDNGAATHNITAPASNTTYTASYQQSGGGTPVNGLNATYFDNMDLTGTSVSRIVDNIDTDYELGSPDPAITPDTWSARWTGQVQPKYSQTYTFYTLSDDGVRLWVNGQQLVDNWTNHGLSENSGTITLTAGQKYDVKMEFYDNTMYALASLQWSSATQAKEPIPQSQLFTGASGATPTPTPTLTPIPVTNGLTGVYYDNMDFTNLKVTRVDPTVNFDWGGGSPDPAIGPDTYTVRWTGFVVPLYSQQYTFYTTTDDGVRLWVNNTQLVNKWIDQAPAQWSGKITLTAGQKYPIKMEYYENGGGAVSKLSWSSTSQAKQIIPQSQLYSQ